MYFLLALIFLTGVTNASSVFFTKEESNSIQKNIFKNSITQNNQYVLSGILFYDQNKWIVWINSKKYSKIGKYSNFSIDKVTKNSVIITADGNQQILTVKFSTQHEQKTNKQEKADKTQ